MYVLNQIKHKRTVLDRSSKEGIPQLPFEQQLSFQMSNNRNNSPSEAK